MMEQRIVFLNGQYMDVEKAKISVLDRGFSYGDGLFETMRAYRGKVFRIGLHLDRLLASAADIFLKISYSRDELGLIIYETLKKNKCQEAIIKLTVTRGRSEPGLSLDSSSSPTLLVYIRPFEPLSKELYRDGAAIATFPSSAIGISGLREQIKSCSYLSHIIMKKLAEDQGAYEAVMLNDKGAVCEGTASNIFIVKSGILYTPPANEHVLAGVTRKVVLEIAQRQGVEFKEESFSKREIVSADEAFLTNTGIEILPVCRADNQTVGDGKPGSLTKSLRGHFLNLIDSESK